MSFGKVYFAFRWHGEIYCGRKKDLSTALSEGLAAWAIDYDDIINALYRGCRYIGVIEREKGGDMFLIEIEKARDPGCWIKLDYTDSVPSTQRAIGYHHFLRKAGHAVI